MLATVVLLDRIPAPIHTTGMIRRFVSHHFEMRPDSIVRAAPFVDAR